MVQTKTEQEKGPKKNIQTEELADATDQPSLFFSFSRGSAARKGNSFGKLV